MNNRYYDPATGVFVSVDPLVTTTGEPYLYGSGNPTSLSDPLGLCATNSPTQGKIDDGLGACGKPASGSGGPGSNGSSGVGGGASATGIPRVPFASQPGLGVIRTNFFIAACEAGGAAAPSAGDCRGFSSGAGCDVSRVCLTINFDEGWLEGSINSSCSPGKSRCIDALALGAGNSVAVNTSPGLNGEFVLRVDLVAVNPRAPNIPLVGRPAINVSLAAGIQVVSRPGNPSLRIDEVLETVAFLEVTGDGYPSVEAYWVRGAQTFTAIQDREGVTLVGLPLPLIPIYVNRTVRYEMPQ